MTTLKRAGRLASGAALLAGIAAAALVLLPSVLGMQRYVIVSGSMTGTYDEGTLVLSEVVPVEELRVGDVITYLPPADAGPDHLITHRIASIEPRRGGPALPHQGRRQRGRRPVDVPPRRARPRPAPASACRWSATCSTRSVATTCAWASIALPALLIASSASTALWRRLGVEAAKTAKATA